MAADSSFFYEDLPRFSTGSRSHGWWAFVTLILIEIMVFSALIVSYFYLFSTAPQWPPEGIEPPALLLPSINALILFASAGFVYWGSKAIAKDDRKRFLVMLSIGGVCLVVFLVLKYVEYSGLDYHWDTHAYGSILWMITGFHTVHVLTVLLKSIAIQTLGFKGFFNSERRSAVEGHALYWIFVAAVWVPLFATLYLFPNLL